MSIQSAIIAVQEKGETIRRQILSLLEANPALTPKEIQQELGIGKEVYYHLRQLGLYKKKTWEGILEENTVYKTTKIGQKTIAALDLLTRHYEERIPKSRQRKADGWNIFAPSLEEAKQLFRDYIACEQERLPVKEGWTAPSSYWALGGYYICALSVLFVEQEGKEMVFFTKKRQKQILKGVAEGEGHTEYYEGMLEELKDVFRYANALIRNKTHVDWKKTAEQLAKQLAR